MHRVRFDRLLTRGPFILVLMAVLPCGGVSIGQEPPARGTSPAAGMFERAAAHAEAERFEAALASLEHAFEAGYRTPADVHVAPVFAALKADARSRARLHELLESHARQWRMTLVREDEPGERIVISGRVLDEDGEPIPDALVYVYHTDVRGIYSDVGDSNPRLFGYLRTNEEGRYEYRTIKPASYPDTNVDEHVHYEISAPGHETRTTRLGFSDDPRWETHTPDPQWVMDVTTGEDGVKRCHYEITLRRSAD